MHVFVLHVLSHFWCVIYSYCFLFSGARVAFASERCDRATPVATRVLLATQEATASFSILTSQWRHQQVRNRHYMYLNLVSLRWKYLFFHQQMLFQLKAFFAMRPFRMSYLQSNSHLVSFPGARLLSHRVHSTVLISCAHSNHCKRLPTKFDVVCVASNLKHYSLYFLCWYSHLFCPKSSV